MADDIDTTAPADDAASVDSTIVETTPEPQDVKFNKTQLQQISSIMGDMIKKSIETSVVPLLNQQREPELTHASPDNPAYQAFNERLSQKFYSGDVAGALQEYLSVHEKANQNITKKQQMDLNKNISGFEEKPHYKDVFPQMEELAKGFVANGYPAGPAAELAYEKSVNSFLMGKGRDNSASLAMEDGGRRTVTQNTGKLPPDFERAYQQGKAKGLFKDRKDYVENLDPRIKAQYGI